MSEYLIQEDTMKFIADATRQKAGITDEMTPERIIDELYLLETDTDTGAPATGVTFYDYDGTVLYSYTVREARALTALPNGPSHDGLPFAGWTHTLDEVNSTMKCLDVGAMYTPTTTKLTLNVTTAKTITVYFSQTVSRGVSVHWNDFTNNTVEGTGAISLSYYYSVGQHTIEFEVTNGYLYLGLQGTEGILHKPTFAGDYGDNLLLTDVVIGANTLFANNFFPFLACKNLKTVVLKKGLTSIPKQTFSYCTNLKFCVIPNTVKSIYSQAFHNTGLTGVILPESITSIGESAFSRFKGARAIIPSSAHLSLSSTSMADDTSTQQIYIRSLNPYKTSGNPVGSLDSFDARFKTVYVPATKVEEYKSSTYWSAAASAIKGEPIPKKF